MKALSLLEPWPYCIFHLGKDVENRSWHTEHRGPLVICSSARLEPYWRETYLSWKSFLPVSTGNLLPGCWEDLRPLLSPGMALGVVDLVGCELTYPSYWSNYTEWNWVIKNPRPFAHPFPVKGRLGLYDIPDDLVMKGQPQAQKESGQ